MSSIEYIVIIFTTNYETIVRHIQKKNIKSFVEKLNAREDVWFYNVCIEVEDYDF